MRKKLWLILAITATSSIVTVILLLVHVNINYQETGRFIIPRYVRNYVAALGLPSKAPRFYTLVEIFGEPCSVDFSREFPYANYARFDGLAFSFLTVDGGATSIEILDSTIRLGRRQIGVGSTRAEIECAYRRHNMSEVSRGSIHMLLIRDGITWLQFHLDENDIVEFIVITFYF